MKRIFNNLDILLIAILILMMLYLTTMKADAQIAACTHEMFGNCGVGNYMPFTYADDAGNTVTTVYRKQVGCLKPGLPACSFAGFKTSIDKITDVGLLAEHLDMEKSVIARVQSEISAYVDSYKSYQRLLGQRCMIDDVTCGGGRAFTIVNVRDYWIEFGAVEGTIHPGEGWWDKAAASRKDYALHFKLAAFGADGNPMTADTGLEQFLIIREGLKYIELPAIKKTFTKTYRLLKVRR
jgi:hypothetical protein